jgi:hypothetical protein
MSLLHPNECSAIAHRLSPPSIHRKRNFNLEAPACDIDRVCSRNPGQKSLVNGKFVPAHSRALIEHGLAALHQ